MYKLFLKSDKGIKMDPSGLQPWFKLFQTQIDTFGSLAIFFSLFLLFSSPLFFSFFYFGSAYHGAIKGFG